MLELNRERGTSLVVVTHDMRLARRMERVYEIEKGSAVASGVTGTEAVSRRGAPYAGT